MSNMIDSCEIVSKMLCKIKDGNCDPKSIGEMFIGYVKDKGVLKSYINNESFNDRFIGIIKFTIKNLECVNDSFVERWQKELFQLAKKEILERLNADTLTEEYINNLPSYTHAYPDIDNRLWGIPYRCGVEKAKKIIDKIELNY